MYETEDDLVRLQELLDRTFARANPHLTSIVSPERRLSAMQIVRYLQGKKHVAFATVNERGEPRSTASSSTEAPVWRGIYGSSPFDWGEGVVLHRHRAHVDVGLRLPSGTVPGVTGSPRAVVAQPGEATR